jgi:hypothetical protein
MTHQIDNLPTEIMLGRQGEKGVNSVLFDVTDWVKLYPAGDFSITYTRQGETAVYPELPGSLSIETTTDDDGAETTALAWVPSAAVMDVAGHGTVVIHCTENGIEKRSAMTSTYVEAGHGSEGTAPEPMADYIAKWGAVDATIEMLEAGTEPIVAVTQDETGTHFAFSIPFPSIE